jgi:hypothetical protein
VTVAGVEDREDGGRLPVAVQPVQVEHIPSLCRVTADVRVVPEARHSLVVVICSIGSVGGIRKLRGSKCQRRFGNYEEARSTLASFC